MLRIKCVYVTRNKDLSDREACQASGAEVWVKGGGQYLQEERSRGLPCTVSWAAALQKLRKGRNIFSVS